MIVANEYLESDVCELKQAVSHAYRRSFSGASGKGDDQHDDDRSANCPHAIGTDAGAPIDRLEIVGHYVALHL
jgi:hypothetical protein